jgi:hypothetical protein
VCCGFNIENKRGRDMAIRAERGDVIQSTTGFWGPQTVQDVKSAKSKYLSLYQTPNNPAPDARRRSSQISSLLRLTLDPTLSF